MSITGFPVSTISKFKDGLSGLLTSSSIIEAQAKISEQWLSGQVLLNDLLIILAVEKTKNKELPHGLEYHANKELMTNIVPAIKKAIFDKALLIYLDDCVYNDVVIETERYPRGENVIVLRDEFVAWQKQAKSVAIPELLQNTLVSTDTQDFNHQQLIMENEALKAKVAELEQRLNEYKELPTQTKNKVMPVIYGLCNLYFNKGKPLTKIRGDCGMIADELLTKFGINIGDKGLENYYKAGKNIIDGK